MNLRQLQAGFIRYDRRPEGLFLPSVETLDAAQGIIFLCPKCYRQNNGPVGTHSVICWFRDRDVPVEATPKPGRWTPQGTGLDDLTFVPGTPPSAVSVELLSGCRWHGHVRNGDAE